MIMVHVRLYELFVVVVGLDRREYFDLLQQIVAEPRSAGGHVEKETPLGRESPSDFGDCRRLGGFVLVRGWTIAN